MKTFNIQLVIALFVFPALGWTSGAQAQVAELTPVASARAPLSLGGDIALPTEGTVCVIESYDNRVHCIARDGGRTAVFGRRGQGPGEFPSEPSSIVRGPDGTIGVVAIVRRHMLVFEPSGDWIFDVRLPSRLQPSGPFDSVLPSEDFNWTGETWENRHLDVDVQTGDIVWERIFPNDMAAGTGCRMPEVAEGFAYPEGLEGAVRLSSGGMYFRLCDGQMFYLADRDDDFGTVMRSSLYTIEYPSESDIERYLENCGPPSSLVVRGPCRLEEYRSTPKRYSEHHWVDDQDRLWVLTNRDREEFSHFDVFVGTEFAGSVRVRHRAVGFDVLGSTLAVLVDRPVGPGDADGYPDRGIDWYDIGGLSFGPPPGNPAPAAAVEARSASGR
ncbi:MAG: hypothetical protein OXR82_10100 [Gammaproteobacteria bacterium]|nr:hypothetical protein [Gammaproteobacteria bacterium]MDE0258720.1 hypothetical protein [Gammaproteobacteria bacterium]